MDSHDDKHKVFDGLWQGARPARDGRVAREGFQALVLCDDEFQPARSDFEGVRVIRCPFIDTSRSPVPDEEMELVRKTARRVARRVKAGEKVLVTCFAGRNRSGLVTALAIHKLTGWGGDRIVRHIQAARPTALSNGLFVRMIRELAGEPG